MGIWSKIFGDEARLKVTGHIDGLFAHTKPTIDSKEYTKRMHIVLKVSIIPWFSLLAFIVFLLGILAWYQLTTGIDIMEMVSDWITIPMIIIFAGTPLVSFIWLIWYGNKNNWTGGLK